MSPQTCAQDQYFTENGRIIISKQTNYQVQSILGEGSFGKVVKCVRLKDKKTVAVKIIKKEGHYYARVKKEVCANNLSFCLAAWLSVGGLTKQNSKLSFLQILALLKLKGLDADKCNIVQIQSAFFDRGNFCFVFEYLDKSLSDFIETNDFRPLPLEGIRFIVQQVGSAAFRRSPSSVNTMKMLFSLQLHFSLCAVSVLHTATSSWTILCWLTMKNSLSESNLSTLASQVLRHLYHRAQLYRPSVTGNSLDKHLI